MAGRLLKVAVGVAVYTAGTAGGLLWYQAKQVGEVSDAHRCGKWLELAPEYDSHVDKAEHSLGITRQRHRLIEKARGDCLEVAAGTARNVGFYTSQCTRLVLTDRSPTMVEVASNASGHTTMTEASPSGAKPAPAQRESFDTTRNTQDTGSSSHFDPDAVELAVADVTELPYRDGEFDTVVDTFGLCSFDNPVAALKEMARVCKPDGQILLLEHGRPSELWNLPVALWVDVRAPCHAKDWGCWWNRDIVGIVEASGLHIVSKKTSQAGTVVAIEAKPS